MMQLNRKWIISIILMLVLGVVPVAAQVDDVPDATPTAEVFETPVPDGASVANPVSNEASWLDKILTFITENDVLWMILFTIGLVIAGRNVSPEAIEKMRRDAAATQDNIVDDIAVKVLELLNAGRSTPGVLPPAPVPIPGEPPIAIPPLLPKGIPINRNPQLNEAGAGGLRYIETVIGGRSIAVPIGYTYRGQPTNNSPHCEVHYKFAGGFEFAIAQKAGRFGYAFTIDKFVLAARQRFAIVVEYDAKFSPVVGPDGNPTVYFDGSLSEAGRHVTPLTTQNVVNGGGEAQWVIETAEEYRNLEVAVGIYMPWASVDNNSTILIKAIRFVPVVDDYGSDAVIRI